MELLKSIDGVISVQEAGSSNYCILLGIIFFVIALVCYLLVDDYCVDSICLIALAMSVILLGEGIFDQPSYKIATSNDLDRVTLVEHFEIVRGDGITFLVREKKPEGARGPIQN